MTRLLKSMTTACLAAFCFSLCGQEQPAWEIEDLSGQSGVVYDWNTGLAVATNGVIVRYGGGVLTADRVMVNLQTGDVSADGQVRVQRDDQLWASDQARYNFKTREFEARQFRTGRAPVFAAGSGLRAQPREARLGELSYLRSPNLREWIIAIAPENLRARAAATTALENADQFPAIGEDVLNASTADLNGDGFVVTDELAAMKQVGLSTEEIVERIQATDYVVQIGPDQEAWLWSHGMEERAIQRLRELRGQTGEPQPEPERSQEGIANYVYTATNAIITADDIEKPFLKVRARRIRIAPGEKIVAQDAVLYIGKVPVFYFPFYTRRLDDYSNRFDFVPGYRSTFGPFLLSSYNWVLNDHLDGSLHVDYRIRRGVGAGPDINYHLGRWGDGTIKYYYLHDIDPNVGVRGADNPENRQRVWFSYLANPATNLSARAMVRYQGDTNIVREFFESEYRHNPQPSTFVEVNKFWENFSLDVYAQPRVNDFLETVERLPDMRLTGFRQQIGETPLYYESETSAGYYRRLFAETNSSPAGLNYSAGRADTYHQIVLPQTYFGWLRFTPRVGGRFTHYTEASGPGGMTEDENRGVFNTGAEVAFKASRLWPGISSSFFDLDGARHIFEPSFNYVFVPRPSVRPRDLPQFDRELPSFRLLPNQFPDYNAIDSIDSQNVMRLGMRNRIQTKRQGQVSTVANWDLYTDWRLDPRDDQTRFADMYSDIALRPRDWLTFESLTRYDVDVGQWRMAYHTLTIQPNDTWSWGFGHFYLRDDFRSVPTALGEGNDLLTSTLFYRLNENWGFRFHHRYDFLSGKLQEQAYTVYRDLRSWTAGLTLRLRENALGPDDYTIAFTFSLKAFPKALGSDTLRDSMLWGY